MLIKIATSIASADWSFYMGQVVETGDEFSTNMIPEDVAKVWLGSGLAEVYSQPVESAALKRTKKV